MEVGVTGSEDGARYPLLSGGGPFSFINISPLWCDNVELRHINTDLMPSKSFFGPVGFRCRACFERHCSSSATCLRGMQSEAVILAMLYSVSEQYRELDIELLCLRERGDISYAQ